MSFEDTFSDVSSFVPGGSFVSGFIKPGGFDNIIESLGLGKLFGQTSKADFLADGEKRITTLFSKMLPINSEIANQQINEILYHLHFLKKHYEINLSNSTSRRSKEGNAESLKDVNETIKKFIDGLPKIGYKITAQKTIQVTFSKSNNVVDWHSKTDYTGAIPFVEVQKVKTTESIKSDYFTTFNNDPTAPVSNYTDNLSKNSPQDSSTKSNNTLLYVGLGALIFLPQIKRLFNYKTPRRSW